MVFGTDRRKCHLDEDERFVCEARMEEGKAATVGWRQAAAQLLPTGDLVHGFVFDDLFEDVQPASTSRLAEE